jgi:hypothetical protein
MKILNNNLPNCPPAILRAAEKSMQRPTKNVYRVTELIDSPLVRTLTEKHWDSIEVEVDRLLESMDGTAWHEYLKPHAPDGTMAEVPFEADIDDITIRGTPDFYSPSEEILYDYKKIKAWKYIKQDWEHFECQLNIYAYFIEKMGFNVKRIVVNAYIKDWSRWKAIKSRDYPQKRVRTIEIKKWPRDKTETYIKERLAAHLADTNKECTNEEKWQDEPTYALKKHGKDKAIKVEATLSDLHQYMLNKGITLDDKHYIETRPGEPLRCLEWCAVSKFCPYYQQANQEAA